VQSGYARPLRRSSSPALARPRGTGKLLELQRTVGNQATSRAIQRAPAVIQRASDSDIQTRAYFIWEKAGKPDGKDFEHWMQAKAELEADEQAALQGKHQAVPAPKDPATVTTVRGKVAANSPASSDAPQYLAERVRELQGLGLASEVGSQADLIPVLAADMKRKDLALPPTEQKNLSDAGWEEAARSQILGNQTTALTTSDDRYTAIKGGEKFDELHEFIHICSSPGGESPLMNFKLQVNEGAINVFSELVAKLMGVKLVTRYTNETPIMKALVEFAGDEGLSSLYATTFKGDLDAFWNAVGKSYVALGDKLPNGKNKGFSDKKWTEADAAAAFKSAAKNWSLKWISDRISK
jgi:hypothetical protein